MDTFIFDIVSNFIANICFWLLGGTLLGLLFTRRRHKLYRFFGITGGKPVVVYFSTVFTGYGSTDAQGRDLTSVLVKQQISPTEIREAALPDGEFQVIPAISQLFASRLVEVVPDMLSGLADSFWMLKRPKLEFKLSPQKPEELRATSSICVGGPAFNSATAYYLLTCRPFLTFVRESDTNDKEHIEVARGNKTGTVITHELGWDVAVLNRVTDTESKNTIFIAAGLGVNGTRAAVDYLISNWEKLAKTYQDQDFGICLKCPGSSIEPEGYRKYEIVLQVPAAF
jgi:hypothetical protein